MKPLLAQRPTGSIEIRAAPGLLGMLPDTRPCTAAQHYYYCCHVYFPTIGSTRSHPPPPHSHPPFPPAMFWSSVPKGPWAGPSPRGNKSGGSVSGSNTRGANARRRQLAPEPYSLGHLRVLFQRLIDAQEGRVEGETIVVETLRGGALCCSRCLTVSSVPV